MSLYSTSVSRAYNDTFCIQRINDLFFLATADEINSSVYLNVDGKKYKLLLRHLQIGDQMFFYILKDEYANNYAAHYSGPSEFDPTSGILVWECAPDAYIEPTTILQDGKEIVLEFAVNNSEITGVCEETKKLNFVLEVPKHYENLDVKLNYDGQDLTFKIRLLK
jgi:hypothetical protein